MFALSPSPLILFSIIILSNLSHSLKEFSQNRSDEDSVSMSSNLFVSLSLTFFLTITIVQSIYNPYLYDDGKGGPEHCCVVPVRGSMCLAKPITRSLVQVNKECSRVRRPRRRRLGQDKSRDEYLDKITSRLNVQKVHENDNRVYIELQTPLKKEILDNDLMCLTATDNQNAMNLEECFVELVGEDDDDYKDPEDQDEEEAQTEVQRIGLDQPIYIREGHGLSFFRKYHLDRDHIQPTTSLGRQCWSWYRDQTRKLRKKLSKQSNACFRLSYSVEKCINDLVHNTLNHTEHEQEFQTTFQIGSKLYCENEIGQKKFLGEYRRGKICFDGHDNILIDHQFTDITRLSDQKQNRDSLDFIEKNKKLTAEFEDDCHGQTNLVERSDN